MTSRDAPSDDAPTTVVPVLTEPGRGPGGEGLRASLRERTRFAISGIRTRILVSYIALLAASIAVATFGLFQPRSATLLLVRSSRSAPPSKARGRACGGIAAC